MIAAIDDACRSTDQRRVNYGSRGVRQRPKRASSRLREVPATESVIHVAEPQMAAVVAVRGVAISLSWSTSDWQSPRPRSSPIG